MTPYPSLNLGTRKSPLVRRVVVAIVALGAGTALAVGAAVTIPDRWKGKVSSAAAGDFSPPAMPAAQDIRTASDPAPAPVARPELPSGSREKRVGQPKPARLASTSPGPAPSQRRGLFAPRSDELLDAGPVDRQCVPRALRARRDPTQLPAEIAVRIPVEASGTVGRVEVLGDVTDGDLARAIVHAVRSCPFNAGSDDDGRPVAQSVIMRIKFPGGAGSATR